MLEGIEGLESKLIKAVQDQLYYFFRSHSNKHLEVVNVHITYIVDMVTLLHYCHDHIDDVWNVINLK